MDRIKSFENFINEEFGMGIIAQSLGQLEKSALAKEAADRATKAGQQAASDASDASIEAYNSGNNSTAIAFNAIPGNDDFALYMQHQQGIAGAAGIVKALNGTGKMAPDTIKTKSGVKYANLVQNVPSDRPQVRKDIIASLDKGDQKTAAALFLNMWKEKWFAKQTQAKTDINSTKNSEVKDAITKASAKYKVPFEFAITVAQIESGLNPKAGNSTYKGLFAMQPNSNYGGTVTPMGNSWGDPYINAENGVKLLKNNITQFKKTLGNDWASLKVGSWANNIA
jgi:hypothetical protein